MSLSVDLRHQLADFEIRLRFDAPPGITVLFGRSGAGKTTVINAVSGLLRPNSGRISLEDTVLFDSAAGINVPVHKRQLGYVFQDGRLFPHLSVHANLIYGRRFNAPHSDAPSLEDVCELLGITPLLDRRIAALSGGEKQRIAIGRALLSYPRMLLMDEPLAALDSARKAEILPYLERLRDRTNIPILYVSHSMNEVARLATTVVVLENGKIARAGAAEQVLSDPDMVRQLGVREAGSVLPATLLRHHDDGLSELTFSGGRLFLPRMDIAIGAHTRVRILAQDIILFRTAPTDGSALNILPVQIIALRDGAGPGVVVQMQCGNERLLARITRRSANRMNLKTGDKMHAVIKSVSIARTDIGTG
jgi:molybdate transport system ATP-binding protein